MHSTVRQEFGKDIGLIHEVVITGRKVGADENFWSKLAHNKELFAKVVEFVTSSDIVDTTETRKFSRTVLKKSTAMLVPVGKYASEVVKSNFVYPMWYKGPRPIDEQVEQLAEHFGLSRELTVEYIKNVLPTLTLPKDAEGWFAIPSIDALAVRFFATVEDPHERYRHAIKLLMGKISTLKLGGWYVESIDSKHFRLTVTAREAFKRIAEVQKGDIWIVPCQLGLHHRGESIRRACELFTSNEFGLDVFSALVIALTHPERFSYEEELDIDLAGNEWSPDGEGWFGNSAYIYFFINKLKVDGRLLNDPRARFGSASGFLLLASSPV